MCRTLAEHFGTQASTSRDKNNGRGWQEDLQARWDVESMCMRYGNIQTSNTVKPSKTLNWKKNWIFSCTLIAKVCHDDLQSVNKKNAVKDVDR